MKRDPRPISWINAARKAFEKFPAEAQERMLQALDLAAQGQIAGIAKPMKGLGSGIYEIALRYRTDAYRVVYAVQFAGQLWVIHAFQKKARKGIATGEPDIRLIKDRIRRVKAQLA
jgi:phage-related protein